MLKAWTQSADDALLILGLTFKGLRDDNSEVRNYIYLWRESLGTPIDVAIISAPRREQIAQTLMSADQRIVTNQYKPIWHCITKKQHNKSLHVCLSQSELVNLRKRPLVMYYRLDGKKINTSFDTLIVGATSEKDMMDFLKRINLIDETTRVECDLTQFLC